MQEGSLLLLRTLKELNKIIPKKQQVLEKKNIAYKIKKEDLRIDWSLPIEYIHNLIRGLSPMLNNEEYLNDVAICPSAWCIYNDGETKKRLKINYSKIIKSDSNDKFLSIHTDNKNYLHINLRKGKLDIINIQMEGKKAMSIKQFLAGNKITDLCTIS